jgi:hypothetical protein
MVGAINLRHGCSSSTKQAPDPLHMNRQCNTLTLSLDTIMGPHPVRLGAVTAARSAAACSGLAEWVSRERMVLLTGTMVCPPRLVVNTDGGNVV